MENTENQNSERAGIGSTTLFDNLQPWQKEMARRAMSGEKIQIGGKGRHGKSMAEHPLAAATAKVNDIADRIHETEVFLGSLSVALKEWTEIRDILSNVQGFIRCGGGGEALILWTGRPRRHGG